ncbi:MAG: hypothetical protein DWQ08_07635 [Proteobacteria bacterium]|nr:MAG: hypothetical protein DWQ08_07635 [Pseudomonadota bacterium]
MDGVQHQVRRREIRIPLARANASGWLQCRDSQCDAPTNRQLPMHTIALKECNVETGLFRIAPSRFTRAIRVRPSVVSITPYPDGDREEIARFIEIAYRTHYGARIVVHYPNLVSLREPGGQIVAAAGFRLAAREPLFLERYTAAPVERLLNVPREEIVEIGNLASGGGGASIFLFMALASYLDTIHARHAVITGTSSLKRRLSVLGLEPRTICSADAARAGDDGGAWGRYYDSQPSVETGDVQLACKRLRSLFGSDFFKHRPRLSPRLYFDTGAP